ncbi:VOC family protein [Longispora urticae]
MIDTVPAGYHTVTPWMIGRDTAGLIDFVVAVFDAEELGRVEVDGAIGHAEVRIGDSVVMLFDSRPGWPATPAFLRLYVADDATVLDRATKLGATVVTRPTEMFWGDRISRFRDPHGNLWWIHQRVAEVTGEEAARRAELPEFVAAMEYATSAEFFPGT